MHSRGNARRAVLVVVSTLMLSTAAQAEEARSFDALEWESGIAGLYGHGFKTFGIGGVSEVKYNFNPRLAAGFRVDGGIQFAGDISSAFTAVTLGVNVATLVKGELYLTTGAVRPFVGLGAGAFWLTLQSVAAGGGGVPAVYQGISRHFGLEPQIGIDFGGVRLSATYAAILGADLVVEQTVNGAPQNVRNTRNFIALELTFKSFGWTPQPKAATATPAP